MSYSTTLTKDQEVRFLLRSSSKNIRIFYIFSLFMLLTGILFTFIFKGKDSFYGYMIISVSLMFFLILLSQNLTYKSFYSVGPEFVLLKRGFSRRQVKIKDIVELKILNEQDALAELIKYQEHEMQSRQGLDLVGSYEAQRKLGKFISYCTVPVVFKETTSGSLMAVIKHGASTDGYFVLMSSKKGAHFLLSPKDCKGFVKQVETYRLEKINKE